MLDACNRKKVLHGVGLQYVGHHDPMVDPSKLKLFSKQKVDWEGYMPNSLYPIGKLFSLKFYTFAYPPMMYFGGI